MTEIALVSNERVADFLTGGSSSHRPDRLWIGHSGEIVTGVQVSRFLDHALQVLEKNGWDRTGYGPGWTVRDVLQVAVRKGVGDWDTRAVSVRCMELVLCAATGARFVHYGAWCGRGGRSFAEVRRLLEVSAEFARRYGPKGGE